MVIVIKIVRKVITRENLSQDAIIRLAETHQLHKPTRGCGTKTTNQFTEQNM